MATITKRKNGKWQAKCRRKGFPSQSKTFNIKADAERWARKIELSMDQSVFECTKAAENTMIDDALEDYFKEVLIEKKSADTMKYTIERLKLVFKGFRLIDVSVLSIREYKTYRLESVKGDTVRKELGLLKRMFNYAMDEWQIHLPKGNPVTPVSLPPKGRPRDRRLNAGEEELLLMEAKTYGGLIHDLIVLAIETGMRRGELVYSPKDDELEYKQFNCMHWEHFNPNDSTVFLEDTKNGDSRTVPLSTKAKQIILSQPKRNAGRVFDIRGDSVGQAFRRVCKRAGIKNLRFHDLRHEATSRFFEKGLALIEVSAITGHKDLAMLKRYTHLRPTDLAKKLN